MSKSARMTQIEALLEIDPTDEFLRYGLAMEYVSVGDDKTAATMLKAMVDSDSVAPYVPAFLMGGQAFQRLGDDKNACDILRRGIVAATLAGNDHARSEMEGLLATIE
jgi:Tfp pilus assembly protein PilF